MPRSGVSCLGLFLNLTLTRCLYILNEDYFWREDFSSSLYDACVINAFRAFAFNTEANVILILHPFFLFVSKIHLVLFLYNIIYITKLCRHRTKLICCPSNRNEFQSQKRWMFRSNTHCFWLNNMHYFCQILIYILWIQNCALCDSSRKKSTDTTFVLQKAVFWKNVTKTY